MTSPTIQQRQAPLAAVHEAIDRMTLGSHELPFSTDELRAEYERIVVAYDGSDGAERALAWGRDLARRHGSEVLMAHVYRPPAFDASSAGFAWYPQIADLYEEARKRSRHLADDAVADLRDDGIRAQALSLEGGPTREIVRLAQARRADLVVTGARRLTLAGRLFLGSTALGILEHAPCSVLVARNDPPPRRILAPTDGSRASYRAVACALDLASETGAELVVQHVLEYAEGAEPERPEGLLKGIIDRVVLPAAPPRVRYVMDVGNAATRILLRRGEEDAGLVVVGSHGKGPVERMVVGSVSRRVANEAHASVLVVKDLP